LNSLNYVYGHAQNIREPLRHQLEPEIVSARNQGFSHVIEETVNVYFFAEAVDCSFGFLVSLLACGVEAHAHGACSQQVYARFAGWVTLVQLHDVS
jgi:hypothetical protein